MNHPQTKGSLGVSLALVAALGYTGLDLSVKLSQPFATTWQLYIGRYGLGALVAWLAARMIGLNPWGRQRTVLVLIGFFGAGAGVCITETLRLLPIATALALLYSFPAFAAVFSAWLVGETVTGLGWLMIGGAFGGAVMILWPETTGPGLGLGHLLGLSAGAQLGLAITLIRGQSQVNGPLVTFFYISLAGLVLALIPFLLQDRPLLPSPTGLIGVGAVALLAGAAQLLTNKALEFISAPKVGVLLMTEVVFAAAIGAAFLAEPLGWRMYLGGALILGCGLALSLRPTKAAKAAA